VDDILNKVEGLKPIATELNVPMSQLAIAWCAANPNVSSVITGATKEHQVTLTPIQKFPDLIPLIMG
jgi:aryl-alcohol dehydrogenase-like predicted oxidoreductase